MGKKVTLQVPRQKVLFDPFRTIKKIHWDDAGQWCSVGVYLGNLDDGGFASISLVGLKTGVDAFNIELGSNGHGNSTFWSVRTSGLPISEAHFKQKVLFSDGTAMRGFGVWDFDAGDSHNGAQFFFKAPGPDFDADVTAGGAGLHTAPYAHVHANKTFTRHNIFASISDAFGSGFDSASFHFNVNATHTPKTVITTSP